MKKQILHIFKNNDQRFGFEAVDYEAAIERLTSYIYKRCKDHKIYLNQL